MKTSTLPTIVIGRNGFEYDATQLASDLFVVGKYIVRVENGCCMETLCRATKSSVQACTVQKVKRTCFELRASDVVLGVGTLEVVRQFNNRVEVMTDRGDWHTLSGLVDTLEA
jgi:hypothetical protein|tara:strand:+ start:2080 stop:2418 length:339 start_codon:yes stop_codon:yes gene_type:complete